VSDASNTQAGKGHLMRHAKELGIGDRKENSVDPTTTAGEAVEQPEVAETSESTDATESTTPEVTESAAPEEAADEATDTNTATSTLDSVDGETPGETSDVSSLDSALSAVVDAAAGIELPEEDRVIFDAVLQTLEQTAHALSATRSQVADLEARITDLTAERDAAKHDLTEAGVLVETMARLPLGRKTAFVEPAESFRTRFGAIYDQDFLKLIDERTTNDG
jgi:hypothetical protein